jgi:protein-disulfide isomerase
LSTQPTPKTQGTRRARRAAERRAASPARGGTQARTGPSPILLITAIVGGLGVVLLGALILLQGSGSAKVDTSGLVAPTSLTPTALADGRTLGKADAPVTLDIWSDYQCPTCGQLARTVEPALVAKYVTTGVLRIVQHDAAFQGANSTASYDESVEPAAGARCAAEQNKFWPFYDWTFANQSGENKGAFSADRMKAIATAAGLDVTAWQACLATGNQQAAVKAETNKALADGVNGTPTMILNGETLAGLPGVPALSAKIEAAAAAAGK